VPKRVGEANEGPLNERTDKLKRDVVMADEKPKMIYNNPRFQVKQYDFDLFVGPAAGAKF